LSDKVEIAPHTGDLEELMAYFHMSTGVRSADGVRRLIAVEVARGTRYFTARLDGQTVGMIGVFCDAGGPEYELEPPEIIDVAVHPAYRRQGVARALVAHAEAHVRAAGGRRLWLYTDGNDAELLAFYRRLGFRLGGTVSDYWGDGTVKAIFRKELK
jgi:ribosomal protein S18 acetylase RimI-like enzyme